VVAAHGNALDPVIPSTTLTAGDVCFASISYQSGTAGISWELNSPAGQPWVTYLGGNGVTTRPDSVDTSGNYYVADTEKAGWASGTSTTAQFTSSGASAVGWDELVVCLPTNPLSAGAQGQRGTSDASSASQSFQWYNPTTGGEYVLAEIAIPGTSVTVSGISSASPSVAWTKIGNSDTREDVEIWGALLTGGYQTFTATASLSGAAVMEANVIVVDDLAGTANVWTTKTASGTSASASVTSFTPTTNDFCVQATNFNAGATTAATTGSSPFQSAYPVQQSGSATRYLWTAYRDDWYSTLGPTTATITPALTSSPDWDEIVACLPAVTVSQPVKLTVANGGATGIFAASGCDTDTGSVTGDGSAHTIHVAASCPVTLTAPADGANTRERFNVAGNPSTTTTFSSCAGGVCPEQDSTYYDQLQNTYQASPSNPSTWDTSTGAVTATGTSVGSAGLTICTTGPPSSGSGTAISCAGWADYNTAVSMGNLVVGASERWAPSTASYSDTTGGNTHSDGYVDQFLVTVRAVPAGAGTTNPASGNDWMNFGSDPISASPNPGSAFITWSEIGPILIAAPGTASTTASISGPGTLTASFSTLVSDGYTFSDGTSRTLSFARAESDAIATADSVARTLGLGRAASDGFAFLESILGNSVFSRSVSDSLAFSDSATAIPQLYRGALDTFSLLDAAATGSSLLRTVADTFALADSPTGKVAIAISVTDAYLLLEGASAQTGITRATGDSISYTDGVLRVVSSQLTAADSFLLSEASFALPNLFRSASDSFGLTDGSGRLVRAFASIGDFLSLGETLGSLKVNAPTIIIASVGDAYTFSESLLKQTVLDRLASDVFVIGDNAQRAIDLVRSATDLFSVATGASQLVSLTRSVVDLYSLGAVSARTLSAYASVTDAVGVLEKVAGTLVTMVVGSSSSSSSSTSSGASAPNGLPSQIPAIVLLALIAIAALALVPILYRRRRTESDAQDAFTGD
jgi:hypothetical protein